MAKLQKKRNNLISQKRKYLFIFFKKEISMTISQFIEFIANIIGLFSALSLDIFW